MTNRLEGVRTGLAGVAVMALVFSLFAVFGSSPALAEHIPATGTLPDNCVGFQAGSTGTQSPDDFPDVDITLDSWTNTAGDPHTVNFTIAGLLPGEYVDVSVKSGQVIQEPGGYGNGSHSYSNAIQNGMSHIRFCVFGTPTEPDPGTIIIVKKVTAGSDTTQVFTFTETGFQLVGDSLAHNESGSAVVDAGGDYSIVEDAAPAGWSLFGVPACESTDGADDSTPADINVSEGETVTCTFTNDQEKTTTQATTTTTQPTTTTSILGTTITAPPSTLPFTGIESSEMAGVAVMLLSGGLLLTMIGLGRREEI